MVLKRENPHKYLLYKPTVSQFLVFLASGHKELPPNGALMIYISGDGCFSTKPQPEDPRYEKYCRISYIYIYIKLFQLHFCNFIFNVFILLSYDHGGVLLSTKKEIEQLTPPLLNSKRLPHGKEPNW